VSGIGAFVEYARNEIPVFYKDVGEHLRAWVPPPPKLKRKDSVEILQNLGNVNIGADRTGDGDSNPSLPAPQMLVPDPSTEKE
jgi:hypothetical protein